MTQARHESRPRWFWWSRDEPHNVWEQPILGPFNICVGVAAGVAGALTVHTLSSPGFGRAHGVVHAIRMKEGII